MTDNVLFWTPQMVLETVDEYNLYCFYLGQDILINGRTHSPFYDDPHPSFGVFERRKKGNYPNEFLWKDLSRGTLGDIFELVRLLCNLDSRQEAVFRIVADFQLIPGFTYNRGTNISREFINRDKQYAVDIDIRIKSKPFDAAARHFWARINVTPEITTMYNTKMLQCYWLASDQETPTYPYNNFGFAYPVFDRYQLYFPAQSDRGKRFRNNFNEDCLLGFQQLQYNSDLLVITKSGKEVKCLRSFGYESIATIGEHTPVPTKFLNYFETKYKRIVCLFDNDGKHCGDKYDYEKVFVPKLMESDKDPTDFCCNHGVKQTGEMLYQILRA